MLYDTCEKISHFRSFDLEKCLITALALFFDASSKLKCVNFAYFGVWLDLSLNGIRALISGCGHSIRAVFHVAQRELTLKIGR